MKDLKDWVPLFDSLKDGYAFANRYEFTPQGTMTGRISSNMSNEQYRISIPITHQDLRNEKELLAAITLVAKTMLHHDCYCNIRIVPAERNQISKCYLDIYCNTTRIYATPELREAIWNIINDFSRKPVVPYVR